MAADLQKYPKVHRNLRGGDSKPLFVEEILPGSGCNPHGPLEHSRAPLRAKFPIHAACSKTCGAFPCLSGPALSLPSSASWSTPSSLLLFALSETKMMGWGGEGKRMERAGRKQGLQADRHQRQPPPEQLCSMRKRSHSGAPESQVLCLH